jgi:hypothetical protein
VNPIIEAGFRFDTISEPQPQPEFQITSPAEYERWMRNPSLLLVRAVKS